MGKRSIADNEIGLIKTMLARIMQRVDDCAADCGAFGKNRWIFPAFGRSWFSPAFCQSLGR